jgi:hypothetical protein
LYPIIVFYILILSWGRGDGRVGGYKNIKRLKNSHKIEK